ncbi:nuclear transport factor 2 family protein [Alteromonas sp. CI.11.F.A3]|uniref:nuclear transport factor 2 family protein n=1 Tax=Alteromonas sp. CI.11.F.A3 TaxID=3079555 RepID=UPI002943E8B9|nr:nuclear transport factor 2 family protein [Alteromonas sp. CI.11.F.A3]WOI37594.1 nuclear transport factor 2 family protein [Alteromonas sp. CI.11.F.A3]
MRLTVTIILLLSCLNAFAAEVVSSPIAPRTSTKDKALLEAEEKVNKVLDALHQLASDANFDDYFALYSNDAVFIGTDATEIWTVSAFKAYAQPHFSKGQGWTYTPHSRHVYFSKNRDVAWFDELLDNKSLGVTRGTGVLVLQNNEWKVSQYHLTIPVPNALADSVAEQIKSHRKKGQ